MKTIVIGGQRPRKKSRFIIWALFTLVALFLLAGLALKIAAPTILESYINHIGTQGRGYAFSVRDVSYKLKSGDLVLTDVKVFNKNSHADLMQSPEVKIHFNWNDVLRQDHRFSVTAPRMKLVISPDTISEIERMKRSPAKNEFYLNEVRAKVGELQVIEQKESSSRRILLMNNVELKLSDVTSMHVTDKAQFQVSGTLPSGGKVVLKGKTAREGGDTPWTIQGQLKRVPPSVLEKIAGENLPFSYQEASLNAEITAKSVGGKVTGEIAPDVKKLNLHDLKDPNSSIARALNEELNFSLPFVLKEELKVDYYDTYKKLKTYRR